MKLLWNLGQIYENKKLKENNVPMNVNINV